MHFEMHCVSFGDMHGRIGCITRSSWDVAVQTARCCTHWMHSYATRTFRSLLTAARKRHFYAWPLESKNWLRLSLTIRPRRIHCYFLTATTLLHHACAPPCLGGTSQCGHINISLCLTFSSPPDTRQLIGWTRYLEVSATALR
jgi:hypothetical protein